jgi:NAD(P)-dependent dehydrogenase (short-subunit alcohol dehydrogenase family)
MLDQGSGGSVVNTASSMGSRGVPGMGVYAASKAAVISLTQTAAIEVAAEGIRVNAVAPGLTETPLLAGASSV